MATTAVQIGAITGGTPPTAASPSAPAAQAAPAQGATTGTSPRARAGGDADEPGGGGPRAPIPPPRGLTVTGEVPNYRPVTEEMVRNPPPGDWLMMRRTYQAWSHSPLSEITADNIKNLRLAWVWAMNEGAANQPTPLVHDGVMFLTNTMNTVQALDAATGELIWENQVGPAAAIRRVDPVVPEHRRRTQLAVDELPPRRLLVIPLSQSCMEIAARKVEFVPGSGGTAAGRRFFEMPGSDGNIGRLAAYDVTTMKRCGRASSARRF